MGGWRAALAPPDDSVFDRAIKCVRRSAGLASARGHLTTISHRAPGFALPLLGACVGTRYAMR